MPVRQSVMRIAAVGSYLWLPNEVLSRTVNAEWGRLRPIGFNDGSAWSHSRIGCDLAAAGWTHLLCFREGVEQPLFLKG
jgi:hypothetical protein